MLTLLGEKFTILSELAGEGGGLLLGGRVVVRGLLSLLLVFLVIGTIIRLLCCWLFEVVWEEEERLALELWVFLEGVAMVSYSFLSQ